MTKEISKETIVALKSGDHAAFEKIFVSYFDKVKCFISGLVKSKDEAEEIVQDIFMQLWINRDLIDTQKSFSTYLYTIARNKAFNHLKKRMVRDSYAVDVGSTAAASLSANAKDTLLAVEMELLIEMVVRKMPERRQEIYRLSRDKGLSNDEISARLNISKKTIENQLSLTLKEIKSGIRIFLLFLC